MADRQFLGGVTSTTLHWEADGSVTVEEKQDAQPILDYAHALRNRRFDAWSPEGTVRHEAEIPVVVLIDECRKRGVALGSREVDLVIEAILNDPKYAYLRAAPKVIDPRIRIKGVR